MTEIIRRDLEVDEVRVESRTIEASLSSETLVRRYVFGETIYEKLDHGADSVDLTRAADGLPLLFNHSTNEPIGAAENIRLSGGKLRATLRFGRSGRAAELFGLVKDGLMRGISIGYDILDAIVDGEHEDGSPIYRVTSWTLLEASIAPVAADPSVGVGRAFRNLHMETTQTTDQNANRGERRQAAAIQQTERERVTEILALSSRHNVRELGEQHVRDGTELEKFRGILLDHLDKKQPFLTPVGSLDRTSPGADPNRYSVLRAIRAMTDPRGADEAGYELELSQELERQTGKRTNGILVPLDALTIQKRTLTAGTATDGAELVATNLLADRFIDVLRARSVIMNLAVTHLDSLVGDVAIPRKTSAATAGWYNLDGTDSITESDPQFDQVSMSPKSLAGMTSFSHKLIRQSTPGVEDLVRRDLADTVATAMDVAAINGSGASNQPLGVLNVTGIGSATYTNGGLPNFAQIVGMESDLAVADADRGALAYLAAPAIAVSMKSTDVGTDTGTFIWTAGKDGRGAMNGYPAVYSSSVPPGSIVFGNWGDLVVGSWGAMELEADPYSGAAGDNFKKGLVSVRVIVDADIAVRHAASFTELSEAP